MRVNNTVDLLCDVLQMSRSTTAPPVVWRSTSGWIVRIMLLVFGSDDADGSSFICSHEFLMVYHGYLNLIGLV